MAQLVIGRTECQILDEYDIKFLKLLDNHLAYYVPGAEHSKAFKGYYNAQLKKMVYWDGYNRLLTKNLKFPAGLARRVLKFYKENNKDISIKDNRILTKSDPLDISEALNKHNIVPRDYQLDAVERAIKTDRGIIRIGTGGGKSLISLLLVAKLNKPSIIYVIGKDLLHQFHETYSKFLDQPVGIIGDGLCELHDINIATIWTIGHALGLKIKNEDDEKEKTIEQDKYRAIRDTLSKMKVHIMDECHLAACDTVQEISKKIDAERVYGMSASPWRDDGADLLIEAFLGSKIVDISAKKLIDAGHLVPTTIEFVNVPQYPFKSGKYPSIYKNYIVDNEERNNIIVDEAVKLINDGRQTIILFKTIKHGKTLYDLLSKRVKCEMLYGEDSNVQRNKVKNALVSGDIKCVLASSIFDIGVDIPSISGLVVAGGGKSSVRALQRIGRVIRKHSDKTSAKIIDFVDKAPYLLNHSKVRAKIYREEFNVVWPR